MADLLPISEPGQEEFVSQAAAADEAAERAFEQRIGVARPVRLAEHGRRLALFEIPQGRPLRAAIRLAGAAFALTSPVHMRPEPQ
jgi:hypothetical protein